MTPRNAGAPSGEDASGDVGYTFPPRSSTRQESTLTAPRPGTAPGARTGAARFSASTANPELVTVAALYVERGGVYWNLPGVDPWDEERDARLYDGPHPVVAHPPCNRWGVMAPFVQAVHGYEVGDDGGCFAAALDAVRRFGGVLEHPAGSLAWRHFDLPAPRSTGGWTVSMFDEGAVCYVEQGRYGLPMRKGTWLYAHGVDLRPLRWGKSHRDHWPAGWRIDNPARIEKTGDRKTSYVSRGQARIGEGAASVTPAAFRDALLAIARSAVPTTGGVGVCLP